MRLFAKSESSERDHTQAETRLWLDKQIIFRYHRPPRKLEFCDLSGGILRRAKVSCAFGL